LSKDIPVAESTEIELDPYGASTIVHIPDMDSSFDISDRNIDPVNLIEEEYVYTSNASNIFFLLSMVNVIPTLLGNSAQLGPKIRQFGPTWTENKTIRPNFEDNSAQFNKYLFLTFGEQDKCFPN
jgi:hypothetical protein